MFTINGETWYLKIVEPKDHNLIMNNGDYTIGCCDDNTKTVYISKTLKGEYLKHVLCHEIVHCAMFSYNVELSMEQEELLANLIATYGEEIINITNDVFKRLC